jgi:hypothetical protein
MPTLCERLHRSLAARLVTDSAQFDILGTIDGGDRIFDQLIALLAAVRAHRNRGTPPSFRSI